MLLFSFWYFPVQLFTKQISLLLSCFFKQQGRKNTTITCFKCGFKLVVHFFLLQFHLSNRIIAYSVFFFLLSRFVYFKVFYTRASRKCDRNFCIMGCLSPTSSRMRCSTRCWIMLWNYCIKISFASDNYF